MAKRQTAPVLSLDEQIAALDAQIASLQRQRLALRLRRDSERAGAWRPPAGVVSAVVESAPAAPMATGLPDLDVRELGVFGSRPGGGA